MHSLRTGLFLSILLLSFSHILAADTLDIPDATGSGNYPERGSLKSRVLDLYGEPVQRIAEIGQPPISRWVYEEFKVYFEYDRVIHSVSR